MGTGGAVEGGQRGPVTLSLVNRRLEEYDKDVTRFRRPRTPTHSPSRPRPDLRRGPGPAVSFRESRHLPAPADGRRPRGVRIGSWRASLAGSTVGCAKGARPVKHQVRRPFRAPRRSPASSARRTPGDSSSAGRYRWHASLTCVKRGHVGAFGPGMVRILSSARRAWSSADGAPPRPVDSSERMCWPAQGYGEVGRCGERSTRRVISRAPRGPDRASRVRRARSLAQFVLRVLLPELREHLVGVVVTGVGRLLRLQLPVRRAALTATDVHEDRQRPGPGGLAAQSAPVSGRAGLAGVSQPGLDRRVVRRGLDQSPGREPQAQGTAARVGRRCGQRIGKSRHIGDCRGRH